MSHRRNCLDSVSHRRSLASLSGQYWGNARTTNNLTLNPSFSFIVSGFNKSHLVLLSAGLKLAETRLVNSLIRTITHQPYPQIPSGAALSTLDTDAADQISRNPRTSHVFQLINKSFVCQVLVFLVWITLHIQKFVYEGVMVYSQQWWTIRHLWPPPRSMHYLK